MGKGLDDLRDGLGCVARVGWERAFESGLVASVDRQPRRCKCEESDHSLIELLLLSRFIFLVPQTTSNLKYPSPQSPGCVSSEI